MGLSFSADHDVVSAVWPPSGLALAAAILIGSRAGLAVFAGALLANATGDSTLPTAAGIAAGNALAAVAGAWAMTRIGFEPGLRRMRDVVVLATVGASFSTALNACVGVGTLWASGIVGTEGLWSFWRVWWLGDMTGVLLVAPAVLLLARTRPVAPVRAVEASAVGFAVVAVALLALDRGVTLAYPVFPAIVLAAMRFRQAGASLSALAVSSLAVFYTANGEGPFVGGSPDDELLRAQVFVGLAALTGLFVAAMRSEWERAEQAAQLLGESERALAEAQKLAHIGSWDWDLERDRIRCSAEMHRIFGTDPEGPDPSYEEHLSRIYAEDRALVDHCVRSAIETGEPFFCEHRIQRSGGEMRTLEARGTLVRSPGGRPVRMYGTVLDVTESRLAQERFRGLLESAPDAMVIVDEDGRIVLVNTQTLAMFGYGRDELIGRPVEILVPERARQLHPHHRRRYVGHPHARPMGPGLELTARRRDGSEFPVEIRLSPLKTAEGMLFSSAIRDVTERKLAAQRLEHQALHDPLTDLPNRVLFVDRLEHALARARRPGSKLAVYFCDIDQFKIVNDTLGHESGDRLLVALPPRLRQALRSADTVARFGGDEFVILCEDLTSEDDATRIAERIVEAFSCPFEVDGRNHHLSVSVGVVLVEGGRASAAEVLRDADAAMYRAKSAGKGRFELFDSRMRARLVERLELESDLRRAIQHGELRLHYQPVFALGSDEYVGAEALVRWYHPERGLLLPSEFIEIAEDSGLIDSLGTWVIAEACRELGAWATAASTHGPLRVSINLSPRQVANAKVVDALASALAQHQLSAERVELEITESVLLEENEATHAALRRIKEMGVRLVLDDFGTGYASLSYLKRFPIDALKIDREFIDGLGVEAEDTAIVAAVLSMANTLGIDVVAEGVETEAQLAWLREHGCPFAQGYLLSPPLPGERLHEFGPLWPRERENVVPLPRREQPA